MLIAIHSHAGWRTVAESWRMQAAESRARRHDGMGIHVLDCFRNLIGR